MNPSVTVVVVNYNGANVLPDTLTSLNRQDLLPSEILLVDDASTDGSAESARRFVPELKILSPGRHTGRPNILRNLGLKAALSPLVLLLDNDVALDPPCLNRLAASFAGHPDAAICTPRL